MPSPKRGTHARLAKRRRSRRAPRILRCLHGPSPQTICPLRFQGRHAGDLRDPPARLSRRFGGRSPGERNLRYGGRRAAVRDRPALHGDPQRLVQLPVEPNLRSGRHPVGDHGPQGAPRRRRRTSRLRSRPPRRGCRFDPRGTPWGGFCAARRDLVRNDASRRLLARYRGSHPPGWWTLRVGLHRVGRDLGRHGRERRPMCCSAHPRKAGPGAPAAPWSC